MPETFTCPMDGEPCNDSLCPGGVVFCTIIQVYGETYNIEGEDDG